MLRFSIRVPLLIMAFAIAGCGETVIDPREKAVIQGVARVKSLIASTATNPMAALSLASAAEQGGTIVTYIAASLPDNADFTCYSEGPRPRPYCVTIRGGAVAGEYVIEGYGQSVDKPVASATAFASTPKRR